MNRKLIGAIYVLNIVFQSFFSLLMPIGLGLLISWLSVERLGAPGWIYAVLITLGTLSGLYSMVRFILAAAGGLDRLEKEQEQSLRDRKERQELEKKRLDSPSGESGTD